MSIKKIIETIDPLRSTNVLRGDELNADEILSIINLASTIKTQKLLYSDILAECTIALIFNKPSLRTRFSFCTGIQAAGGNIVESTFSNGHNDKEQPRDMIRVLQGYSDALIIRTHEDSILEEIAQYSTIPIINGLSKNFHPCQIISDFQTIQEHFGTLKGLTLCYVGDGNNILHTLMIMVPLVGMTLHYACPKEYHPHITIPYTDAVKSFDTPIEAVKGGDIVYTDVWTSMGFEHNDETAFHEYQVNEVLMSYMKDSAVLLHCLPMVRGKEVSETLPDSTCSLVFPQSHNRMYAQLALLVLLLCKHKEKDF